LLVYGQGGNDIILVSGSVNLPSLLDGGSGNDLITAGGGDNIVLGGSGSDVLHGGSGRDLLVGGTGGDMLLGSSGDDVLIAGLLSFTDEHQSLLNIMAEWRSERGYKERVANISGVGAGPRHNGDDFLRSGTEATVLDDEAVDLLLGDGGWDWFFLDLDKDIGLVHRDEIIGNRV
jgi:hypothetical protein